MGSFPDRVVGQSRLLHGGRPPRISVSHRGVPLRDGRHRPGMALDLRVLSAIPCRTPDERISLVAVQHAATPPGNSLLHDCPLLGNVAVRAAVLSSMAGGRLMTDPAKPGDSGLGCCLGMIVALGL